MKKRRALVFLVVSALLALATGSALAVDTGERAPEIGVADLRGRPVRMASLRGKVVVVDFWATWCAPCRVELPILNRLYGEYRERGLVVVGVSVDNTADNVRTFLGRTHLAFPIVHDGEHVVADRYSPPRMPSSYLIDRRGVIRYVHEGFEAEEEAQLEREIVTLLNQRVTRGR